MDFSCLIPRPSLKGSLGMRLGVQWSWCTSLLLKLMSLHRTGLVDRGCHIMLIRVILVYSTSNISIFTFCQWLWACIKEKTPIYGNHWCELPLHFGYNTCCFIKNIKRMHDNAQHTQFTWPLQCMTCCYCTGVCFKALIWLVGLGLI